MAKVEFGLVKDKFWLYYKDGSGQPETVQVTEVYGNTVTLSNGDRIQASRFYEMCEPMVDDEPMIVENEQHKDGDDMMGLHNLIEIEDNEAVAQQKSDTYDPVAEMMAGVAINALGVPILNNQQAESQKSALQQEEIQRRNPQQKKHVTTQTHESPLIALTEKGQTKLTKINFQLEVPTVNKTLFNALMETYPEDEIDELLNHFINKVGIDNVKTAIKEKLLQFYKPGKKHVASQS